MCSICERKRYKKVYVGETTSYQSLTSVLGNYILHTKELKFILEENINLTAKELNKLPMYKFIPSKELNKLFTNRDSLSLSFYLIPGINHVVPTIKDIEFKLSVCLWKEDETVRHLIKYESNSFKVISFLPNSTFFLYEGVY